MGNASPARPPSGAVGDATTWKRGREGEGARMGVGQRSSSQNPILSGCQLPEGARLSGSGGDVARVSEGMETPPSSPMLQGVWGSGGSDSDGGREEEESIGDIAALLGGDDGGVRPPGMPETQEEGDETEGLVETLRLKRGGYPTRSGKRREQRESDSQPLLIDAEERREEGREGKEISRGGEHEGERFSQLPLEILVRVLGDLDVASLLNFSLVARECCATEDLASLPNKLSCRCWRFLFF